jgi:NCS2 family nucleobase:cation symporter-2
MLVLILAVSVELGVAPVVSPHFFGQMPHALAPLPHSGIQLASVSAMLLNVVFNGVRGMLHHNNAQAITRIKKHYW